MARQRSAELEHLAKYPGLGIYPDGRYFFRNPYTKRQRSLQTKEFKQALGRWALAKTLSDKAYANDANDRLAVSLQQSNVPISKGANIHLRDFLKKWRVEVLEAGLLKVKIKRDMGKPVSPRTQSDYQKQAKQLESSEDSCFPLSSPQSLLLIRKLLSPWIPFPTHYNHLKAMLGRVFEHAVLVGLLDRNPMRDIDKLAIMDREVLIPDKAYREITDELAVHRNNKRTFDGAWRVYICDLFYMFSQQPVDLFSIRLDQIHLEDSEFGAIYLSRVKTSVAGIIEMNGEMRVVIDWLLKFRAEELAKHSKYSEPLCTDHLLIYPAYMDLRYRWRPVTHRTFSGWWAAAVTAAGYKGMYRLMDMRKMGLTDEFVNQGENDKGLHETQAMKDHYRLKIPAKRSRNTLVSIRSREAEEV